jgi:glycosyltransferase involved in cell wall biosynthesis
VRLGHIGELKPRREQAIIINVGTRLPTTLALLSALRHAGMPVLLVDCESKDDSLAYFTSLLATHDFDLLSAPLKPHGRTLDWLFANVRAETVLLIDSDLEILAPDILAFMRQFIDDPQTFGCGFIDGPGFLVAERGFLHNAYYHERPWMPLAMFDVTAVREALAQGCSFVDKVVFNDFVSRGFLTKVMRRAHETLPVLKRIGVDVPEALRTTYNGWRPEIVYYDTGAAVYEHLKFRRERLFVGIPARFHERYVTHFSGVSRHVVQGGGTAIDTIAATVIERLRVRYGVDV